jgi:hypothetical protein
MQKVEGSSPFIRSPGSACKPTVSLSLSPARVARGRGFFDVRFRFRSENHERLHAGSDRALAIADDARRDLIVGAPGSGPTRMLGSLTIVPGGRRRPFLTRRAHAVSLATLGLPSQPSFGYLCPRSYGDWP